MYVVVTTFQKKIGEIQMDTRQLQQSMLFRGMTELEITKALQVLEAHEKSFQKGETLLIAGTITERMGLVLEGSVTIESNDAWGNRTIISHVGQGQVFAETYALLENEPMLVDVTASEDCRVLFLRSGRIQSLKNSLEPWALKYITNLLTISMHKNLILSGRSFHTAPKTIRGRVMAYLNSVSLQKHSREFDIPFDRQQLADYLNLERSALSKELGKMQKDKLIFCKKNHFLIRQTDS
jgi:CRP-like cAMP-binding protein